MKVLFLPTASWNDPPSRYRILQYLEPLNEHGISCLSRSGVSDYVYERFAPSRGAGAKAVYFGLGALSRSLAVLAARNFDAVFMQRLVVPHVYPFPEVAVCRMARLMGKRIIFDFDDAIFSTSPHRKRTLAEKFSDRDRVARVIARCDAVIAGNAYLAAYARLYNANVTVIPTAVDTKKYPLKHCLPDRPDQPCIIGWIGMPGALPYLNLLKPVFQALAARRRILIRIVGGVGFHCPGVEVEHLPWSLRDETNLILSFDIGVMPLGDSEEARGKCGLKLLQYMAAGLPAVASPISANREIITDGINGYLAGSRDEWIIKLDRLIESPGLRRELGLRGRETVERHYSLQANLPRLAAALKGLDTEDES